MNIGAPAFSLGLLIAFSMYAHPPTNSTPTQNEIPLIRKQNNHGSNANTIPFRRCVPQPFEMCPSGFEMHRSPDQDDNNFKTQCQWLNPADDLLTPTGTQPNPKVQRPLPPHDLQFLGLLRSCCSWLGTPENGRPS